jgi:hypothetical protein
MKLQDTLANIQIASPCPARWDQMEGDERARFCGQCNKHVYNLSAMSAEAAAALVREKEGNLCARFYRRADGTMLHGEDCPVGLVARQWRRVKSFAGAAASLVLLLMGVSKTQAGDQASEGKKPSLPPTSVMGAVCLPSTPSPTPAPTPKPPATPPAK